MPRKTYKPGAFTLVVRRSASGLGLFAEQEIPKGACVIEYVGVEISRDQEETSRSRYLFEIHSRKTIDGAPRWNTARYINHSCRPNCEPSIYKGRIYIHARRGIKPGEELTYDYGKNYFNEFLKDVCACPKCRPAKAAIRAAAASIRSTKSLRRAKTARKRA